MANEIRTGIRLEGDASGAKAAFEQVRQSSKDLDDQVNKNTDSSEQLAASFKKLVSAVAGWQIARQFVETADAMVNMQSRLKLVVGTSTELVYVQGRLFDIAQQSRVSYLELGGTYAQIARATSALGVSQDRLLNVTQSIGQAMTIGGGSAQSMQAAMVQLSQGLASGTLRGDELNSIMEQTPRLAQAIADGMGISLGQLRAYGQEGKLSALAVVEALEKAGPSLKREFEQVNMTVGGAMTSLQNSGARFVGEFDKATGTSLALANSIKSLGDGVDSLATSIGNHKDAWSIFAGSASWAAGITATAVALPYLVAGIGAVAAVIMANPIIASLAAIGAVGSAVYSGYKLLSQVKPDATAKNREDFMRFERGQQNAEDGPPYPGAKPIEEVRKYGKLVVDVQRETYDQSVQIAQAYQNRIKLASSDDERVALTKEMQDRLIKINRDAAREIKSINEQGAAEARQLAEAQFAQRKATLELVASAERYTLGERTRTNEQLYKLGLLDVNDYYQRKATLELEDIDISTRLVQAELQQARAIADSTKKIDDKLQAQARVLGLEKEMVSLASKRKATLEDPSNQDALLARQEKLARQQHIAELNQIANGVISDPVAQERARFAEEARRRLEAITNMPDGNSRQAATERYNEWVVAKNNELAERLKPGYQKMLDAWQDTTRLMRETYNSAMEGMLRSGEDEFMRSGGNLVSMTRSIASAIEQELLRAAYRKYLAGTVSSLGGSLLSSALQFMGRDSGFGGEMGAGLRANEADLNAQIGLTPSAKGNVFKSPGLSAFSNGVYSTPHMFAFAKGAGIFAEAGPEAIMPLTRMGDGNLGVRAAASVGESVEMHVTVINNTGSQLSVRQQQGSNGMDLELVLDMVDSGMADRVSAGVGALPRAMEGRYGLRTAVN